MDGRVDAHFWFYHGGQSWPARVAWGGKQAQDPLTPYDEIRSGEALMMDDVTSMQELTPEQAVARLEFAYNHACSSLRDAFPLPPP